MFSDIISDRSIDPLAIRSLDTPAIDGERTLDRMALLTFDRGVDPLRALEILSLTTLTPEANPRRSARPAALPPREVIEDECWFDPYAWSRDPEPSLR